MAGHDYRTALVTGASSGIGAALAQRLAASGIHVALAARRESALTELAETIRRDGGSAEIHPLDVSEPEATIEQIQTIDSGIGGLDLIIANAGVGRSRWSGKLTWDDCSTILDVNVRGAVATLIAALPRMVERGRGHLVGISSLAQYRGLPRNAVYSASKAFLSTFLEGLRVDVRNAGITVTDIRPGYVKTPLTADNRGPMPMAMEVGTAADEIWDAIVARKSVHGFPAPLVLVLRSMSGLPNGAYDRLAGRLG